jgi:poly(hydroxyalkanoate) granule-associated protein
MTEKERGRRKKAGQKEPVPADLTALTRRVLLAGVGAAALAHDEAKAFLDRLVERGELAQDQARDMLKEVAAKREGRLKRVGSRVRARMDRTLGALDVPRRGDLEALQQRLDHLTRQVEALLEQKKSQDA